MLSGSILSNMGALDALGSLATTQRATQTQERRLSSGKKINTPADNPAGSIEAQGFTSQTNGITQALQNANEGVSLLQTAQGGVKQQLQLLDKLQSIATEASNGTETPQQRQALQGVVTRLLGQIGTIANQTQFNGRKLLNGTFQGVPFQVGSGRHDTLDVSIGNTTPGALAATKGKPSLYRSAPNVGQIFNGHDYATVSGLEQTSGKSYSLYSPGSASGSVSIQGFKGSASTFGFAGTYGSASASGVNALASKTGVTAHTKLSMSLSFHGTGSASYKVGGNTGSHSITLAHNSATAFVEKFNALKLYSGKLTAKRTSAGVVEIEGASGVSGMTLGGKGTSSTYMTTTYKQPLTSLNMSTFTYSTGPTVVTDRNGYFEGTFSAGMVLQSTHPFTLSPGSAFGLQDHSVAVSTGGSGSSLQGISVTTQKKAEKAMGALRTARKQLTDIAAYLGAKEQRFRSVASNLGEAQRNTRAGRAVVESANIPKVAAKLIADHVHVQTGIAALKRSAAMQKRFLSLVPGG